MDEKTSPFIFPISQNFYKTIIYPRKYNLSINTESNKRDFFKEKSYICKYILRRGTCFRPICTFAHDFINFNPKECLNFYNCKNKNCLYLHNEQTKKELFEKIIKISEKCYIKDKNKFSSICKNYKNCKFLNCNFAHSYEEFSPNNCIFGENCLKKENCLFSHFETKEKLFMRIINNMN